MSARTSRGKRAAIYARISRNPARDEAGVRRQEKECGALAATEGLEVVAVHSDDDRSAYKGKRRPGWTAMLELIESGGVDVLLTWHPDRLTRHPRELEDLVELLERAGVKVRSVTSGEYDLASASGRMTARVVGAVARHESEHKGERQRSKASELARAGKVGGGGYRPFGYEDDRITVRKAEADELRAAAARIIDGASLRATCAGMKLSTTQGAVWSANSLRRALIAPRSAGLREHQGEVVAAAEWPAILDRATWESVRATLTDPRRLRWRPTQRYLLTGGIAVTPDGRPLIARPNGKGVRCYIAERDGELQGTRIQAAPLEALVTEALLRVTDTVLFPTNDNLSTEDASEIEALEAELEELAGVRGRGEVTLREWMAARKPLLARLDAARSAVFIPDRRAPTTHVAIDKPGAVRAAWATLSITDRRAVVAVLIEHVVVAPALVGRNTFDAARVDIRWRA